MKAELGSEDLQWGLQRPRFNGVLVHVSELPPPPDQSTGPGAAERRGVGPGSSDLRTLRKAPSLLVDSVKRRPFPVFLSQQPGGATSPGRAWWSQASPTQAGISPWALPATPYPVTPKSWVQCLLSHSNASNEGVSRRLLCGRGGGALGRVVSTPSSPCLRLVTGGPPRAGGPPVPPLRVPTMLCACDIVLFISFAG